MATHELALFAGAGGGILGSLLRGAVCVGAVEVEQYPREVLLQRQRDGILPAFPVWDDIRTFRADNDECGGYIEKLSRLPNLTISGGFPCQDISCAGKGAGIEGERSGLWTEMARVIREIRPDRVFVENSPMLVGRGLALVIGDLASMGYASRWGIIGAKDASAPHKRDRVWIVAHSDTGYRFEIGAVCAGRDASLDGCDVADSHNARSHPSRSGSGKRKEEKQKLEFDPQSQPGRQGLSRRARSTLA